jgi:indole-3-glycerol phosphate synthase
VSILARILDDKRREVAAARAARPGEVLEAEVAQLDDDADRPRSLIAALRRPAGAPVRVLAEIKRASPSAGPIRPGADPAEIARAYLEGGAAAISVLTDAKYFDGELGFLARVRAAVPLPALRKDFLVDPYQVLEARAAGADAVLLIAAALDDRALAALLAETARLGMDALVEVHDADEARRAVDVGATLIGINHRNLGTFAIDMSLTERLVPLLPRGTVVVGESGIKGAADVARLGEAGAHAVLVGESLMRAASPAAALRALRGAS